MTRNSRRLRLKISHRRLDKKIWIYLTSFIVTVTLLITGTALGTSTFMVIRNTKEIAAQKIDVINASMEQELNALASQGQGFMMNTAVQAFLKTSKNENDEQLIAEMRSAAQTILNGQPNLNLIEIFQEEGDKLFFRTDATKYDAHLIAREEYRNAVDAGFANIKMLYTNKLSKNNLYTLVLYIPIYSTTKLNQQLGVLVFNYDCSGLNWMGTNDSSELPFETYLLDEENGYFILQDTGRLGEKAEAAEKFHGRQDTKILGDSLYIYRAVGNWDFYLMGEIPTAYILKDSFRIIIVILLLAAVILILFFITGFHFVKKMYEPMDEVVKAMDMINESHMDVRLSTEIVGEDFKKVVSGFNGMLSRLSAAMETIKEEERQIQLLRFSALQSQIQPHFLYNTLESIHWQAAAMGNVELSAMVKALASYYRVVLSKGRDVITLEEELLHVKNYVTIQNIRYENIIEFQTEVNQELLKCQIPKITLQPLIENAIYHGIRLREGRKGIIRIEGWVEDGKLIIQVEDNGEEMTKEKLARINQSLKEMDTSFGYGVQNVNKRIQLAFGSEYGLSYMASSLSPLGVGVRILLPGEEEERGHEDEKSDHSRR